MQLQHIELGKLKDAAINMRHAKAAADVSDILPSVKARGVLVPLLVRPNGDADQFWTLQNAAKRGALLAGGWADVEILETGWRFCSWEHEKTPKKDGGRIYITVSPLSIFKFRSQPSPN